MFAEALVLICMQGAHDHIDRLQGQVQTLESRLLQPQPDPANSESQAQAQAELAHLRAGLAESQSAVSQLQRQLREAQAETLMLKESQGGSNKASDVIHALESQVRSVPSHLYSLYV